MTELLLTLILLAVDIVLVLAAIWILLKASLFIAICAIALCFSGVNAWGLAIIAVLFTVGKWLWAKKNK